MRMRVRTAIGVLVLFFLLAMVACSEDERGSSTNGDTGGDVVDEETGQTGSDTEGSDVEDSDAESSDVEQGDAESMDVEGDVDDAECADYEDSDSCESDGDCHWVVATCEDEVVSSGCFEDGFHPDPPVCEEIDPEECEGQTSSDDCDSDRCQWLEPGCEPVPPQSTKLEEAACFSRQACQNDTDCPEDYSCVNVWYDMCADGDCMACGSEMWVCTQPVLE